MKSLGCDADALGVLFMPPRGAPDLGAVLIAHDLGRRQAGLVLGRCCRAMRHRGGRDPRRNERLGIGIWSL